jgi:hypothetical protein
VRSKPRRRAVSLPFVRGIDEEFEHAGALATIAGVFLELPLHADARRGSARYLDRVDDAVGRGYDYAASELVDALVVVAVERRPFTECPGSSDPGAIVVAWLGWRGSSGPSSAASMTVCQRS